MVWAGLKPAELCALLKDPKRNGGRDSAALVHHMDVEPLVIWGWAPGKGRKLVPVAHRAFIEEMQRWIANNMPCPK